jgi:uncharacterized protein
LTAMKAKYHRSVVKHFKQCYTKINHLNSYPAMESQSSSRAVLLSLSLLVGLLSLGYFIYKGLKTFSDKDRVVTVKGLAEMNMTATAASISLSFAFSGDDLPDIMRKTEIKKDSVMAYLSTLGLDKNSIKISKIGVNDRQRYYDKEWRNGQQIQVKIDRYTISQSLTIQSNSVEKTEDLASQIKLDLVRKDLTSNISTNYSFPELNSIKPQLIAESTKNARLAGDQFANDSQAKLGKIKTASQGQISIAGQYYYDEGEESSLPQEPYIQKARVVSTIVFFLE